MAERRDWIEDFEQKNGQYSNTCVGCYRIFVGHKRRVLCKTCGGFNSTTTTSNIIEEQDAEITRLRSALWQIVFYVEDHVEPGHECIQCLIDDTASKALKKESTDD